MSLEERIKRLEEEDKPRKIKSWLDIVEFARQGRDEKIEVDGAWGEFIKMVLRDLDRSDKRSAHLSLG